MSNTPPMTKEEMKENLASFINILEKKQKKNNNGCLKSILC